MATVPGGLFSHSQPGDKLPTLLTPPLR
jgi:hypothetical protein